MTTRKPAGKAGKTKDVGAPRARPAAVKQGKVVEKAVEQTQQAVKSALKQKPLTLKPR